MLKEPIEMSFFAIQANFPFTDTNSTEAKSGKIPSINRNSFPRKLLLTKLYYRI